MERLSAPWQHKIYADIDTLPIYNFKKCRETGDYSYVIEQKRRVLVPWKLAIGWENLFNQWLQRFRGGTSLDEYVNLIKKIVDYRAKVAATGDALIRLKLKEVEEKFKKFGGESEKQDEFHEYAAVGKFMGMGFMDPKKVSTSAYYAAVDNMRKAAEAAKQKENAQKNKKSR